VNQRIEQYQPTLEILASRWGSAGPLITGFALLAGGRPVAIEELAKASGVEITKIEEAIDAARCERDAHGRLIDLYGLTLTPTRHRLEIGHKILFSCCALWAQVIPKLVDSTVRVESVDPMRQELVRLSISPAGLESMDPPAAAATLAVTTQEAVDQDVSEAWCCQVCYFVSHESAEEFAASRPTCHAVELAEFQKVAEFFHRAIWSAVEA
jgi:alkylmercury lyase